MSNLVVKMMSGENLADSNGSKGFTLVEAYGEVRCVRDRDGKPLIEIPLESGQVAMYHPEGNTYLLKNGKTVASYSYTLQSDVAVKTLEIIKSNCSDWHYYSECARVVTQAKQLEKAVADKTFKFVMIHDHALKHITRKDLQDLNLQFVTAVLNPDVGDRFTVYQDINHPQSNFKSL